MYAGWTEGNWPIYMSAFGVYWVPFEESEQYDEEGVVVDWIIWTCRWLVKVIMRTSRRLQLQ